jgi:hypothetical protein
MVRSNASAVLGAGPLRLSQRSDWAVSSSYGSYLA